MAIAWTSSTSSYVYLNWIWQFSYRIKFVSDITSLFLSQISSYHLIASTSAYAVYLRCYSPHLHQSKWCWSFSLRFTCCILNSWRLVKAPCLKYSERKANFNSIILRCLRIHLLSCSEALYQLLPFQFWVWFKWLHELT